MDGIISRRPGAIVRFAMPVLLLILAAVITSGFLFYFPETIVAKASVIKPAAPQAYYEAEARIRKKYLSGFRGLDSIDVAVGIGLPKRNDIKRVKFTIVKDSDSKDNFMIRLFLPHSASIMDPHVMNTPGDAIEIMILLEKRSLREIVF